MINPIEPSVGTPTRYTVALRNGVRVRTLDEGHGPAVLLLHGNPDNADEYTTLIGLLKNDFRCIAPDLPGYGPRDGGFELPPRFDYSRAAQIEFVDALLAELNIQGQLTLVVHDIGGIMGVPWAAANVQRLAALVYTNTVAFPKHQWFNLAYRWGKTSPVGRRVAGLSMQALNWFGGALFRRVFARQNPQLNRAELDRFVVDFALNATARRTTLVEFRQITRPDFFEGYDQMLQSIAESVPTVAVWGAGDPYIADRCAT